tara:strand:- start:5326 stop:5898 length:573 start_codon:yes stop_codon:yes gene_type:complete
MGKRVFSNLSLILFFLGVLFIINSEAVITGAVVSISIISSTFSSLIGFLLILISGVLFVVKDLEGKIHSNSYFKKRAGELTKDGHDLWISQWELNGLIKTLKKKGYEINYGHKHISESHHTTPKHINVEGYNQNSMHIKKHLFITRDPYNKKLSNYQGFHSNVYHPKHPRDIKTPKEYIKKPREHKRKAA